MLKSGCKTKKQPFKTKNFPFERFLSVYELPSKEVFAFLYRSKSSRIFIKKIRHKLPGMWVFIFFKSEIDPRIFLLSIFEQIFLQYESKKFF